MEYKNELDSTLDKIEINQNELIQQEKKFNNFLETINISNKIINYIKDNINNNTRELEEISAGQNKIIDDLDQIEKNLDKKIKIKKNKDEIVKENDNKNNKIKKTLNDIEEKINKCHEKMKQNNKVNEYKEIKTLNQLLNRIHCRIKKEIQGKQIDYLNNIFQKEKTYISDEL